MNKLILPFSLLLMIFALSCTEKEEFTIKGQLSEAADSTKVYLQTLADNWKDKNTIDTAIVLNGVFEFKGIAKEGAKIHFVTLAAPTEKVNRPVLVIVEPGQIDLVLDSVPTVKGTPSNDAYRSFTSGMMAIDEEINTLYKTAVDTTQANKDRLEKVFKEKQDQMVKQVYDYAKTNIKSQIGVYAFLSNSYMLSLDQTKELLAAINPGYKEVERVKVLEKRVQALDATAEGKIFTDLKGKTPEGVDASLSDYAGKGNYVLIDFWASWCPPCRAEMPNLVEAYKLYKNKGFEIVGISLDKELEPWKAGIQKLNITWPQISDLKYWDSELSGAYGVSSIPHLVLLDREGKIIARGLHGEELAKKLAELFK